MSASFNGWRSEVASEEPPSDPEFTLPADPLSTIERAASATVGSLTLAAGTIATFRSDNQVGTGLLLLMSAAFLLMGVQGTPLIQLGGENGSFQLERRVRRAAKIVEDVANSEGVEPAQVVAQAMIDEDPSLASSEFISGYAYESRVRQALERILGDGVRFETSADASQTGFDGVIVFSQGRPLRVQIKYAKNARVGGYAALVANARGGVNAGTDRWLFITNGGLTMPGLDALDAAFVQWRGTRDDMALRRAIYRARPHDVEASPAVTG